jgi:Helix-turn-helix domain
MAERLGCAKATVHDALRRFGFTQYRRVTHAIDREQLAALRADGLSAVRIAELLGCSKATVQRALVRWDMPALTREPKPKRRHIIDPEQLADLRAQRWTPSPTGSGAHRGP